MSRVIRLRCDAESHSKRRVKIASFSRRMDDPLTPEMVAIHEATGTILYDDGPDRWQVEYGELSRRDKRDDFAVMRRADNGTPDRPESRWAFECRLCGLKVAVRETTLGPMLSRMQEHGVSEISLTVLAAILTK